MTARWENPNVTTDSTSEPLRTLLRPLEALQPQIDAIDLDVDLNERDTYALVAAMGISASGGDPQVYGNRFIKLGVLKSRGMITSDEWRELIPAVDWRDREEGVKVVADRPFSTYTTLSDEERLQRASKRRGASLVLPES